MIGPVRTLRRGACILRVRCTLRKIARVFLLRIRRVRERELAVTIVRAHHLFRFVELEGLDAHQCTFSVTEILRSDELGGSIQIILKRGISLIARTSNTRIEVFIGRGHAAHIAKLLRERIVEAAIYTARASCVLPLVKVVRHAVTVVTRRYIL